jgi:hypothetical protein
MRYQSGGAFRQALEDRLRKQSVETGVPLVRLRKMVAFERFLVRLQLHQPGEWLLKGGFALQLRLGNLARTTQDVDLLLTTPQRDMHAALVQAALLELGDWFRFLVQQSATDALPVPAGGTRFAVQALLDSRPFERFHVDVGWGDPVVEPAETLVAPSLLEFAEIPPAEILCYPMSQHLAEKVHAYTRPRDTGDNSRVKDLIDMWLIARAEPFQAAILRRAFLATFEARGTHSLPGHLPDPPRAWALPFRALMRSSGLAGQTLQMATDALCRFLDPVLQDQARGRWDPVAWGWRD